MAVRDDGTAVLKFAGLFLLVVLILVGALLPLKYTARMHLPKQPTARGESATESSRSDERDA